MIRYTIIDRPGIHEHVPRWRGRCTYCGHRVAWKSPYPSMPHVHVPVKVVETRRQPWRIPAEIVMRYLAMRHTDRLNSPTIRHEDDDYQTELLEEDLT